jgi:hypothetical protein
MKEEEKNSTSSRWAGIIEGAILVKVAEDTYEYAKEQVSHFLDQVREYASDFLMS